MGRQSILPIGTTFCTYESEIRSTFQGSYSNSIGDIGVGASFWQATACQVFNLEDELDVAMLCNLKARDVPCNLRTYHRGGGSAQQTAGRKWVLVFSVGV